METLPGRNWDITYIGAAGLIVATLAFIVYMASNTSVWRPIVMAAGAGAVFAVSSRLGDVDRLRAVARPLAGFLAMVAGVLLVGSGIVYSSSSLEMVMEIVDGFGGDSVLGLVRAVFLPLFGYSIALFGTFIAGTGATLVVWDRVDDRVSVGAGRTDLMFTGILGALTLTGVFGTAFLRDIPIRQYAVEAAGMLVASDSFGGVIAAVLLVVAYRSLRWAWRVLPIRELVPRSERDSYDRLARWEAVAGWVVVPLLALGTAAQGLGVPALRVLSVLALPAVRRVLGVVAAGSLAVVIVVRLVKLVTGDHDAVRRLLPYVMFGLVAYLSAPLLTGPLDAVIVDLPSSVASVVEPAVSSIGPIQAVMVLMTVASAVAVMLKLQMDMLSGFGLVPEGLGGTTLVAAGILFAAVGFHLFSPSPVVLFTGVAVSMATWEVGKRSVILGQEIGRAGSTYQAELVQLVSKAVIVAVVVVAARTLLVAVENMTFSVPSGPAGLVVFLLAVVGVGLLTAALKDVT